MNPTEMFQTALLLSDGESSAPSRDMILMHDVAECVSLALTFPTIVFGLAVVVLFYEDAATALSSGRRTRTDCLILGIFIGFVGGVLDNTYWAIPWTLSFVRHADTDWWMAQGVYFNVFSRQLCGWAAAYFHVRAALWAPPSPEGLARLTDAARRGRRIAWRLLWFSAAGAVAHIGTLLAIRCWM